MQSKSLFNYIIACILNSYFSSKELSAKIFYKSVIAYPS